MGIPIPNRIALVFIQGTCCSFISDIQYYDDRIAPLATREWLNDGIEVYLGLYIAWIVGVDVGLWMQWALRLLRIMRREI